MMRTLAHTVRLGGCPSLSYGVQVVTCGGLRHCQVVKMLKSDVLNLVRCNQHKLQTRPDCLFLFQGVRIWPLPSFHLSPAALHVPKCLCVAGPARCVSQLLSMCSAIYSTLRCERTYIYSRAAFGCPLSVQAPSFQSMGQARSLHHLANDSGPCTAWCTRGWHATAFRYLVCAEVQ